jgi:polysaccharide biosynthesis protein VpsJ
MVATTAYAGEEIGRDESRALRKELLESVYRLAEWLKRNEYQAYDPFDGLNARLLRFFTFETKLLRTVLQQGVRRFPFNMRPSLGICTGHSSKGMGFLARGFIRLHAITHEEDWSDRAEFALRWLIDHQCPDYSGACWGNHFDYQSRSFYLPKGVPTVVWTSLIGHAFLDGYEHYGKEEYLLVARRACDHIISDLARYTDGEGACISYVPGLNSQVHNANTLGGSLLARTCAYSDSPDYREVAQRAFVYTAQHQRPDGSWWYGEKENLHWVDNFHTAYVLDSFKRYAESTGDRSFDRHTERGYYYWKDTFFLPDGTPKYYDYKLLPIDIQCCSQAIDTLVFYCDRDQDGLNLACKVARWTIKNMQDPDGHFYYRRYSSWLVNKTPTLHWGQATMLSAMASLVSKLPQREYPA